MTPKPIGEMTPKLTGEMTPKLTGEMTPKLTGEMTNEELWQTVLAQIQLSISPASFATWFRQTSIVSQENGEIVISVPSSFSKEWLKSKYHKLIGKIIDEQKRGVREIKYIIGVPSLIIKPVPDRKINQTPSVEQLDFQELKVDRDTNLNPRYVFDNFIVGSFNELAHAAATAVAKAPGQAYNPLFIYGGVGLGKTHLLQAIGNEINKGSAKKNIRYMPAERFTSEIVNAIRNHQIETLKIKFQRIDIFIIDDVQFLAGKEKTQEEFFHLFNSLYEKNKQIILSSDRPPKAIASLTERLRSRFEGGMIADISLPDVETRIAILKTKISEKKVEISEEIINYTANTIQKNIRELEGALNRLITHQKIYNKPLTMEVAKSLLSSFAAVSPKISSPKKIVQTVSDFYDLKEKEVFEVTRKKEVVKPRQIVMFLLREELNYSFPAIGRVFRGKDHTTAIHAFKKIKNEINKSDDFAEEINLIKKKLYGL
ncbi:chromosomal replication initiator protein DnaA [Candidatus Parcubacteria bacterium]|nr:chromosomal replication initiator protein DnaA [Patescibacteria group bacterium]MBU4466664.1 chromosomal replication initiator protein DnaA [Patescibacteria group bacterium]MCG2688037.1 chromosomal replication initiator protein DnaA [Candidatus Parcubacteria bacterium]